MSNSDAEDVESDSDYDPDNEFDQWPKNQKKSKDNKNSTESENDTDDDDDDEELITKEAPSVLKKLTRNYIQEIYKILEVRQDVNYKNALEINKEMQNKLVAIRIQIQTLHNKIMNRYAQNEERLVENMCTKKGRKQMSVFGKFVKGRTFVIRGNTFFRDENMRNCPNNEDYTKRCKKGEIFPMDFDLVARHIWSIQDKMSIVKGIKEQIISEKSLSIRISNKNAQLTTLLEIVGKDFKIDWTQIATHSLSYRHSTSSCKAMWNVYLQPALKHDAFSESENERLIQAVQKYNYQNWSTIAKEVGKRSDYQCFLQYHTSIIYRGRWPRWDKKDDSRLLKAIEASKCNGVINWSQVAFQFPQKSKPALQQRYQYAINPTLSHEPFSAEEDLLLIAAVQEYGKNFAKIPRTLFPNRSVIQLRQRYNNTIRHRDKIAPWTLEDDKILMEFVKVHGASSWKKCEEAFENRHTRISCRQRYLVIQKHLSKNANFTLEKMIRKSHHVVRRSDITPTNWQQKVEELRTHPIDLQQNVGKAENRCTKMVKTGEKCPKKKVPKISVQVKDGREVKQDSATPKRAKKRKHNQLLNNTETLQLKPNKPNFVAAEEIAVKKGVSTADIAALFSKSDMRKAAQQIADSSKPSSEQVVCYVGESKIRATKKAIYVERLRANGLRYHGFFKYAYNFRFGREPVPNNINYVEEIAKAKECLGCQMPENLNDPMYSALISKERNLNGLCSPVGRRQSLRKFLKDTITPGTTLEPSSENKVPPNFSTLSALRALCALSADYAKRKEQETKNPTGNELHTAVPITVPSLMAVDRFRQRFRNLFYEAAVLSRLPPLSLENQSLINHSQKATEYYRPSTVENLHFVKRECFDESDPFTPLAIKTEFDFEAYKETNQETGYS